VTVAGAAGTPWRVDLPSRTVPVPMRYSGGSVLPPQMARRSLTTLRERLVKMEARLTRYARRLILQLAEVAIARDLFGQIVSRTRLSSPIPT